MSRSEASGGLLFEQLEGDRTHVMRIDGKVDRVLAEGGQRKAVDVDDERDRRGAVLLAERDAELPPPEHGQPGVCAPLATHAFLWKTAKNQKIWGVAKIWG